MWITEHLLHVTQTEACGLFYKVIRHPNLLAILSRDIIIQKGCARNFCAFDCYWVWILLVDAVRMVQLLYDWLNGSIPNIFNHKCVYIYMTYCIKTFSSIAIFLVFPHRLESKPVGQTWPLTLVLDPVPLEWVCGSQTCSDTVLHLCLTNLWLTWETSAGERNRSVCVWRRRDGDFNNRLVTHPYSRHDSICPNVNSRFDAAHERQTIISNGLCLNTAVEWKGIKLPINNWRVS